MSDFLPAELVSQILMRLPAKTLLTFRCVNTSWYSLISSSTFISSHFNHNHNIGNYNLLLRRFCDTHGQEINTIHDENRDHRIREVHIFPFRKAKDDFFTVVGCINGLICLWDNNHVLSHVVIWNPAIRNCFRMPNLDDSAPNKEGSNCFQKLSFGFGFDAITNEYKVLRVAFLFNEVVRSRKVNRKPLSFYPRKPYACSVDIFSMNSKSWRSISESLPLEQLSIGVFVNGSLHWLAQKEGENVWFIVSFSMHFEVFGEMACPQDITLKRNLDHEIAVFGDSVALFQQFTKVVFKIWVMKEYGVPSSWMRFLTVKLDNFPKWMRLLGFSWSKELVLIGNGHCTGRHARQPIKIVNFSFEGFYWAPHAEPYIESLVLLEDGQNSVNIDEVVQEMGPSYL